MILVCGDVFCSPAIICAYSKTLSILGLSVWSAGICPNLVDASEESDANGLHVQLVQDGDFSPMDIIVKVDGGHAGRLPAGADSPGLKVK